MNLFNYRWSSQLYYFTHMFEFTFYQIWNFSKICYHPCPTPLRFSYHCVIDMERLPPPPLPLCPAAATVVNSISAIWRNFVISKKNVSVVDNHSPWSKLNIFTYLLIYIQLTLENYLDIWRACLKSFKLRLTWQSWTVSEKPEPVWRV
jgi:hypothetical protein